VIHAYAIAPRDAPSPGCRGLGEAPLELLGRDGLLVVYSRHDAPPPRATPELVLAHERVVEAVMARAPVLPFRFGTRIDSADELVALLDERRERWLQALEHVRGRVELAVRVLPSSGTPGAAPATAAPGAPDTAAAPGTPASDAPGAAADQGERATRGREHLHALAARARASERAVRELHAPLAALASDSALRERPPAPAVLVAAYLVEAGRVAAFRASAAALAERVGGHDVVVTGPLPPYSFVGEG
jgi:hypothetical protein